MSLAPRPELGKPNFLDWGKSPATYAGWHSGHLQCRPRHVRLLACGGQFADQACVLQLCRCVHDRMVWCASLVQPGEVFLLFLRCAPTINGTGYRLSAMFAAAGPCNCQLPVGNGPPLRDQLVHATRVNRVAALLPVCVAPTDCQEWGQCPRCTSNLCRPALARFG